MLGPNDFDAIWDPSLTINYTGDDDFDIDILGQHFDNTATIKLAHACLRLELQQLQYEELGDPRSYAGEVSRKKGRGEFVIPPPGGKRGKKNSGSGPGDGDERRDAFDPGRGMGGDGGNGGDGGGGGDDGGDDKDDNNGDMDGASETVVGTTRTLAFRRPRSRSSKNILVYDVQSQSLSAFRRTDIDTGETLIQDPRSSFLNMFTNSMRCLVREGVTFSSKNGQVPIFGQAEQLEQSDIPTSFRNKASRLLLKMRGKRKGINVLDKPRGGHSSIGIAEQCVEGGGSRRQDGVLEFGSQEEEIWS